MSKKLVQVVVSPVFAEVDDGGEIGEMTPSVQFTVSGKQWRELWESEQSRTVFANILAQLAAKTNGALSPT